MNELVTAGKEKEVFGSPEDLPISEVLAALSPKVKILVVLVLPPLLLAGGEEADDGVTEVPFDGVPNVKVDGGLGNEVDVVFEPKSGGGPPNVKLDGGLGNEIDVVCEPESGEGPPNAKVIGGTEILFVGFSTSVTAAFWMFCS